MTEIFLGNPPANIVDWIKKHSQPAAHEETWYKYNSDDIEWGTVNIVGTINHGELEEEDYSSTTQIPEYWDCVNIEIGTNVTSIESYALRDWAGHGSLRTVLIPETVTSIGVDAFAWNDEATFTFKNRTLEEVQALENYPWGVETSNITVA